MIQISIKGHHVDINDSIRKYIRKRLKKVENHFRKSAKIDVVLHKERSLYFAEATIHSKRMSLHAKSRDNEILAAIDDMASKLDRQVIKFKERLTDHGRHIDRQRTIRNI